VANTKLTSVDILKHVRGTEAIYRHGTSLELEIDVSSLSPDEVAREIRDFIGG